MTLNSIGVSCANIPAGYHNPHKDDEYTVIAELENSYRFIKHFVIEEKGQRIFDGRCMKGNDDFDFSWE
ncbi:MAG: hypothetical protein IKM77_12390 [Prevotella sp.]|nr:hypothetical protein [Prevotella sp.]